MLAAHLRQAATVILEIAIRIAPPGARYWGQAMRAELGYIEGSWAAVNWALGGASVMAKHALLSLLIPGRRGITPGDELFARNISLRKALLAGAAAFVLVALLFFAAPPFRQGLRVSLAAWHCVFGVTAADTQPELRELSERAKSRHDPEGLAFAAARTHDDRESAQLAEEAVHLDPTLIWVYAVVAVRHPELPEIGQWLPQLERRDPRNALLHLTAAESIDSDLVGQASKLSPEEERKKFAGDPAWQSAMAAAFASPGFDDYLDRLKELDRRVVSRYRLNNPYEVLFAEENGLPAYADSDSQRFAKSLLVSGEKLEARGDIKGAAEQYWTVAHFGQVMDSQGDTRGERGLGTSLQAMAYRQLQTLSERAGHGAEATLFAYLAGKFGPRQGTGIELARNAPVGAKVAYNWAFGQSVSSRNAAVLQISGLMMLIFSGLVVVAASVLIVGSRRGGQTGARRAKAMATVSVLAGAVGFLVSSATVYLTYRPYWYIFQRAVLTGDTSQTGDLRAFLMATQTLPGVPGSGDLYARIPVYFWTGVTVLGFVSLGFILLRHFLGRARASAAA